MVAECPVHIVVFILIAMTALHSQASSESLFSHNLRYVIIFSRIHNETATVTMYSMVSPIICSNSCHFT